MSSLLNEVIKETIKQSIINKITLTPENYMQLFCKVASSKGLSLPECNKLKDYIARLDISFQKEISKLPLKSEAELFSFLISRLNRAKNDSEIKLSPHLWALCRILLEVIKLFYDKEARQLSGASLDILDNKLNEANIKLTNKKWQEFIANYDNSFIKNLKKFSLNKNDDLKDIVNSILNSNILLSKDYYSISKILLKALKPSISKKLDNEFLLIKQKLQNTPQLIDNEKMQANLDMLIDERIQFDQQELKNQLVSLDKILEHIQMQLQNYSQKFDNDNNTNALLNIKKDLENLDNYNEFSGVKNKLENIANSININLKGFVGELSQSKQAINNLKEQIKILQEQLEKSMQEATNDFLTGLYTKRALQTHLERIDQDYIDKDMQYCICFFDIDYFKKINDTYGHSAGDIILAKVGSIFQKYSRNIDILARFGGEEFIAILPLCDIDKAQEYAKQILKAVSAFEFIYKNTKFSITISCGIASRTATKSYKSCLELADNMLYEAKKAGRNCVKVFEK